MTVRVDLMKHGEFRRQGAVSGAFVVRITIVTTVSFAVLFGLIAMLKFRVARADLRASKEIWEMRKPFYERVQSMKHDVALGKQLDEEMGSWEVSRVLWHMKLFQLQQIVPVSMQIRRLSIRGELEVEQPPVRKGKDGKKTTPPPKIARQFFVTLEGKTSGNKAEDIVVQFVRVLGRAEGFQDLLESIKLQSLQRDMSASGEQTDRRFVIDAETAKLDM